MPFLPTTAVSEIELPCLECPTCHERSQCLLVHKRKYKSIVKFGYRGERLIEPSSSWFLPKFPSG
ncbi:hypothetical protein CALVIDRAFT_491330 [Calocera viscosa TUFC12733]|uniref:Uncharacterized protein n=1 Tax=Calocera viscosa (strain TUFC12733) TaxID=1330018 RepID=A0A167FTQ2_CALVF|nr:hypothetical protein CALVIDRAFT_491330 [Calocera viscosa TUFC12733]